MLTFKCEQQRKKRKKKISKFLDKPARIATWLNQEKKKIAILAHLWTKLFLFLHFSIIAQIFRWAKEWEESKLFFAAIHNKKTQTEYIFIYIQHTHTELYFDVLTIIKVFSSFGRSAFHANHKTSIYWLLNYFYLAMCKKKRKKKWGKEQQKLGIKLLLANLAKQANGEKACQFFQKASCCWPARNRKEKAAYYGWIIPGEKRRKKKQKIMSGEKGGDLQLLLCSANIVRIVCHSCLRKEGNFSNSRWGGGGEKLFLMAGGRKKKKGQHSKLISTFQESSVTQVWHYTFKISH